MVTVKVRKSVEGVYQTFREIHRQEKGLIAYGFLHAILAGVCTYISLLFIESVFVQLERRSGIWNTGIVSMGILWCVLSLAMLFCKRQYDSRLFPGFLGFVNQVAKVSMERPYSDTMDAGILALAHQAQNAVSGSGVGLHKIMTSAMEGLGNMIGCISAGAVLGRINWWIPLYCFILIIISNWVLLMSKKIQLNYQKVVDENQRKYMNFHLMISDFVYGKDIRLLKVADWLLKRFEEVQGAGIEILKKICEKTWKYSVLEITIVFMREGGIVVYFVVMLMRGYVPASEFIVLLMGLRTFSDYGNRLMGNITDIHTQEKYVESYFEYIQLAEKEEPEPEGNWTLQSIEFCDVSFKYPGSEQWVLRNFSLKIEQGEKIALVGLNGAGKTTVVSLLCRFFEPTEGCILTNHIPITEIPIKDYYKLLAAVFQDATVFAFSLWENITMSRVSKNAYNDFSKVQEVLNTIGLAEKIDLNTDFIQQNVSKRFDEKGMNFSGGEQCKLVLARALYKNAPCILLDEPTAALDPIAEKELYEMIGEACKDKTMIFISHRMASARFCDRIIFLKEGKIIEDGTFEELLTEEGEYAHLFEMQARYYEEKSR